jgi:hypothetical protein
MVSVDALPAIAAPSLFRPVAGRGLFHVEHGPRAAKPKQRLPALFRPRPCSTWNTTPAETPDPSPAQGGVGGHAKGSGAESPRLALTHLAAHHPPLALTNLAEEGSLEAGRARGRADRGSIWEGAGFRWGVFKLALPNLLPLSPALLPHTPLSTASRVLPGSSQ